LIAVALYVYLLRRAGVGPKNTVTVVVLNLAVFILLASTSIAFAAIGVLMTGTLSYVACLPWKRRVSPGTISVVAVVNAVAFLLSAQASLALGLTSLLVALTCTMAAYSMNA
jgi:hypothetical protein